MKNVIAVLWLVCAGWMAMQTLRSLRTGEIRTGLAVHRRRESGRMFWAVVLAHGLCAVFCFYMYGRKISAGPGF